jgi:site-specific DNA-cytosine methylase
VFSLIERREIRHFHLFAGLGGGAKGFNRGSARVGNMQAHFRCIGGIDVNAGAIRDFERIAGVRGTLLDLFDRQQYRDFHGCEPGIDWKEATPDDIREAAGQEHPHIVFLSPPCKGFSGLLSQKKSATQKYQALNRLTIRGLFLLLEAFKDDLPELILLENVPRILTRGRHLLDQMTSLLHHYGYAVSETTHDCGELGGLAQSRKRFLMVARNIAKVPPFLYEPPKRALRSVGEVLDKLPLPGHFKGGPMHRVPNLQWKTWVRLAFVEAGSDWRSLNKLRVVDGNLADFLLAPDAWFGDTLGVLPWTSTSGVVTGMAAPTRGAFSVADPRFDGHEFGQYGVRNWSDSSGVVTGQRAPGQGWVSVADPRLREVRHNNVFRVAEWNMPSPAVTGGGHPTSGGICIADPRTGWKRHSNNLSVMEWDKPSNTVISGGKGVQGGWLSVADPRPGMNREKGDDYLTAGHYGVVRWNEPSGAVAGAASHDNGNFNVADPRFEQAPDADEKLVAMIRSLDGTWHRPFTTLELASLQSLVDPDDLADLDGKSDGAKRERIGNAVPPDAATAIASTMAETLLLAWSGETFMLSNTPIWVRDVAVALSVRQPEYEG